MLVSSRASSLCLPPISLILQFTNAVPIKLRSITSPSARCQKPRLVVASPCHSTWAFECLEDRALRHLTRSHGGPKYICFSPLAVSNTKGRSATPPCACFRGGEIDGWNETRSARSSRNPMGVELRRCCVLESSVWFEDRGWASTIKTTSALSYNPY